METRLRKLLARTPATPVQGKALFTTGKKLIAAYESIYQSGQKPHHVNAVCRIPFVVEHLRSFDPLLSKKEKKWLEEFTSSPMSYRLFCELLARRNGIYNRYTVQRPPSLPPTLPLPSKTLSPERPTFIPRVPDVVACKPSDLILLPNPPALRLKRCAIYVRLEVKRLLTSARRLASKNKAVQARSALSRAIKIDPKNLLARERMALVKVRLGDISGAVEDVRWFRAHVGDDDGDRVFAKIKAILDGQKAVKDQSASR